MTCPVPKTFFMNTSLSIEASMPNSRRAGILPAGSRGFQPRRRRGQRQVCVDTFIKFC